MPIVVVNQSPIRCSMAVPGSTGVLVVQSQMKRRVGGQAAATVADSTPTQVICGVCNSASAPPVQAATAAALGVHTPAPCMPNTTQSWKNQSPVSVKFSGKEALMTGATLTCSYGGTITIINSAQQKLRG